MQWEPLGTTSQYKQPIIIITHAKIVCYLTTWASFHPGKHINHLCFHCPCSHCLRPFSLSDFGLAQQLSQAKWSGFGPGRRKNGHLIGTLAPSACLHRCLMAPISLHTDAPLASCLRRCCVVSRRAWQRHSWSQEWWADQMGMNRKQDQFPGAG